MANVNKWGVGQLNEAYYNGKKVTRQEQVMMLLPNGLVSFFKTIPDDIHFLFQRVRPYTSVEVVRDFGGRLPDYLQGPTVMCTCGSEGVLLLEGEYRDHVICRSYLTTGKHQTSFKIVGNRIILDDKTASERTYDPEEIIEKDIRYKPKL